MTNKIGVMGLGKLGLSYALVLKTSGYDVIGVDVNNQFVDKINNQEDPIGEPQVKDLLKQYPFIASTNVKALKESEVIFIVVPTPSNFDGSFDDKYIRNCLEQLQENDIKPKVINIVSTVSPQTCYNLTSDYDFNITYNPSLIALGRIVNDLLHPDFVMIGSDNKKSFEIMKQIHEKIYSLRNKDKAKIYNATLMEVEIAKIALNVFITQKINFSNMLGEVCDKLQEENIASPNVDNITEMIGNDRRIGHQYLKSGMAFGGPCFPRDNNAFATFAKSLNVSAITCKATDSNNQNQSIRICHKIKKMFNKDSLKGLKITILGATYKPNTTYIGESPSLWLAKDLKDYGAKVNIIDQNIPEYKLDDPEEDFLHGEHLVIICDPTIQLSQKDLTNMSSMKVLDCWRTNKHLKEMEGVEYYALGA